MGYLIGLVVVFQEQNNFKQRTIHICTVDSIKSILRRESFIKDSHYSIYYVINRYNMSYNNLDYNKI